MRPISLEGGSTMKEYKVVEFDCYVGYQKKLEDFLNEMARQGWILKTIFHQAGMAVMDLIFERDR
jgi:hypothetical protein